MFIVKLPVVVAPAVGCFVVDLAAVAVDFVVVDPTMMFHHHSLAYLCRFDENIM